ncbi:acetyltransferase [Magnetospirillum fulvum]|nr:acetyltransferase [Magnetospirillum fulvum]
MSGEPLLLIGAGGHARSCIDVIEMGGRFRIVGLIGTAPEVGTEVLGYPVLGTDIDLPCLVAQFRTAAITLGQIKSPAARMRLFSAALAAGAELPAIVSPLAHVSRHAELGAGTIVLHRAVINAGARIGRNVIINTMALVEHDAEIGDHCHIATAAVINGGVRIGAETFIGSNASIRQEIQVGTGCVIGMGQRVVTDCADGEWLPPGRRPS